jgi:hypothetical protein
MQGLSPEHPEASQPLHTTTPEGTPEDSPRPGEIPLVTLSHVDISDSHKSLHHLHKHKSLILLRNFKLPIL